MQTDGFFSRELLVAGDAASPPSAPPSPRDQGRPEVPGLGALAALVTTAGGIAVAALPWLMLAIAISERSIVALIYAPLFLWFVFSLHTRTPAGSRCDPTFTPVAGAALVSFTACVLAATYQALCADAPEAALENESLWHLAGQALCIPTVLTAGSSAAGTVKQITGTNPPARDVFAGIAGHIGILILSVPSLVWTRTSPTIAASYAILPEWLLPDGLLRVVLFPLLSVRWTLAVLLAVVTMAHSCLLSIPFLVLFVMLVLSSALMPARATGSCRNIATVRFVLRALLLFVAAVLLVYPALGVYREFVDTPMPGMPTPTFVPNPPAAMSSGGSSNGSAVASGSDTSGGTNVPLSTPNQSPTLSEQRAGGGGDPSSTGSDVQDLVTAL